MKKLTLESLREVNEVLSRKQMKAIMGGLDSGSDECNCNNKEQCTDNKACRNCGSNGENGRPWGVCDT